MAAAMPARSEGCNRTSLDRLGRVLNAAAPFVLLDDTRRCGARLYRDPVETIVAAHIKEVRPALDRLRAARDRGLHVAGFLTYEAGSALEPRLETPPADAGTLLWFGLFDRHETIADVAALLPDPAGAWAAPPRPVIAEAEHAAALAEVQRQIAAGDIYQANLTFPAAVDMVGHPLALYARLRQTAGAAWGGIVFTGTRWLLSFSPELFFTLEGRKVTARPMKGTAARSVDDDAVRATLAADPKQRAENLMIVDLIRNDLGRVAEPGSVAVPELFAIETYPTIHQMTSTVTATLAPARDAIDILAAAFPCGSITGAPKIRAMEVIRSVERAPRRAYTGSIGRIDADGDAAFNVAIRTLDLADGETTATLGLGSGIVADSDARSEWRECLAKGAFIAAAMRRVDLIETIRFDPEEGLCELDRHLARLHASAGIFGHALDCHTLRNELQAATFRLRAAKRVRMMLSPSGKVAIEVRDMPPAPAEPVPVAIVALPVSASDYRLRHKTSDRAFYDRARAAAGMFEVAFVDADGFLTEGSFTNLFVERDRKLLTPPLSRALLPGVLRALLIDEGRAIEGELTPTDLAGGFLIGNALRGLIPARVVAASENHGL